MPAVLNRPREFRTLDASTKSITKTITRQNLRDGNAVDLITTLRISMRVSARTRPQTDMNNIRATRNVRRIETWGPTRCNAIPHKSGLPLKLASERLPRIGPSVEYR